MKASKIRGMAVAGFNFVGFEELGAPYY